MPAPSLPDLQALRRRADPLADDVVAALRDRPRPGENVLARVRQGAKAGDRAMQRFLDEGHSVPPWADFAAMEAGRRAALRHAPLTFLVLLTASLVETFAVQRGAKVLLRTGRLLRDPVPRMYETAAMLRDVLQEGGVLPGGRGHEALLRVRLLHAWVRRFVRASGWDEEQDGAPVNQMDLLHTLMCFSSVVARGLDALGARLDDDERESWCRLWRFAGRVVGVDEEALFEDAASEATLYRAVRTSHYDPDEGSRALCFAVLDALDKQPPFFLPKQALYALSRRALGDDLADRFGLPRARRWSALAAAVATGWRAADVGAGAVPLGRRAAVRAGSLFVEVNRWRVLRRMPEADYAFKTA